MAEVDVLAIFPFRGGGVFLLFGNAGVHQCSRAGFLERQWIALARAPSARRRDDGGRFGVELRQDRAGHDVVWTESHRPFKFSRTFPASRAAVTKFARSAFSPYTRPSQRWNPPLLGSERHRFSARGFRALPNPRARSKRGRASWKNWHPAPKKDGHSTRQWLHRPRPAASISLAESAMLALAETRSVSKTRSALEVREII